MSAAIKITRATRGFRLEIQYVFQFANSFPITLQAIGWKPKDACPESISAGAYERVRDYASHTVSDHYDLFVGDIAVRRIKGVQGLSQAVTECSGVCEYRSAAG